MITPVWLLVAKVMENHDRLMQSSWGRGEPGNRGPGDAAHLPYICFPGCLQKGTSHVCFGQEGAALNFLPLPAMVVGGA